MRQLFLLIYRYRSFFTFTLFQIFSFWLIIGNNKFHSAAFFNTSNQIVSYTYEIKKGIYQYFNLSKVNEDMAKENAFLRELISSDRSQIFYMDSTSTLYHDTTVQFEFIPAAVINNSTRRNNNFVTINKGNFNGVEMGMGVIGTRGVVGKVKSVSSRYATIYSLLHSEMFISSKIDRLEQNCTVKWLGGDPQYANLLYVPKHVKLFIGDSISTSGFNATFPEGIQIGTIDNFSIAENQTFHEIKIKLSNDFSSLTHVYVIKNNFVLEKDSLEMNNE